MDAAAERTREPGSARRDPPAVRTEWLRINEACALIGVSPATLRRWSDAGEIASFTTPGGHRRFSRTSVLDLSARRPARSVATRRHVRGRHRSLPVPRLDVDRPGLGASTMVLAGGGGPLRAQAQLLAGRLVAFFEAPTARCRAARIREAEAAAVDYGRAACRLGIDLPGALELFLRFRMSFLRELGDAAVRQGLREGAATSVVEAATEAVDRLTSAIVRGHQAESGVRRPA